jgi:hypothetical protein
MAQTRLGAALLLAAAVQAAGCGAAAPTGPSLSSISVTPTLMAGVWRGAFNATSCTGNTSSCNGLPETFVLRLAADGSGVMQIDTKVWDSAPPIAVGVTQSVSNGVTTITGSTATSGGAPSGMTLEVRLELTTLEATAEGSMQYVLTRSGGPVNKTGRVLYASRDATAYGARFQGDWQGFVARNCTGDCTYGDPILPNSGVQMLISQFGSAASVRLASNEIAASVSGDTVSGTSHFAIAPASCVPTWDDGRYCLIDVTFSATADSLDRMHGTITYRVEGVDYRGRPIAFSASAAFDGVARWR